MKNTLDKYLHELVDECAQQSSGRNALEKNGVITDYASLYKRSNCHAGYLQTLGVGPGIKVGLLLEDTDELITAVLGVLKAGGVCLILQPNETASRLRAIIDHADPIAVITQNKFTDVMSEFEGTVLTSETSINNPLFDFQYSPSIDILPETHACIVYHFVTSQRVSLMTYSHKDIMRFLESVKDQYDIQSDSAVYFEMPVQANIYFWLSFIALMNGATLFIAKGEESFLRPQQENLFKQHQFSVCFLPATCLSSLMQTLSNHKADFSVSVFTYGGTGESDVARALKKSFDIEVKHLFGADLFGVVAMLGSEFRDQNDKASYKALKVLDVKASVKQGIKLESTGSGKLCIGNPYISGFENYEFDATTKKFVLVEGDVKLEAGILYTHQFVHISASGDIEIANHKHSLNTLAECRQAELSLTPELQKIVYQWNDTASEYQGHKLIQHFFEEQARNLGSRVAAVLGETHITYRELESKANQLAHYLQSKQVGPEVLVGVCLERSFATLVAVLGILKAGGGYVPLEPTHPKNRLETICQVSELKLVITETQQTHATGLDGIDVIVVDGIDQERIDNQRTDIPSTSVNSNNIAYVIFTSGSTGTPKGVVINHKSVINLLEWLYKNYGFNEKDRGLFVTSLSFDLSVFDIFGLLGAGGVINMITDADRNNPQAIAKELCDGKITFWNSAPTTLALVMSLIRATGMKVNSRALRLVYLSGDWIPLSLPDEVREFFPNAQVVSLGGATEATVWSNYYNIEQIDPAWRSIPYGKPIQNAKYYVLDETLKPCPVDVEGDLYIGGDCVCREYLNAPEINAKSFVTSPFSSDPTERLYRTGDLAKYFPDGNLEFLGRKDFQVKVRGFRIELKEIEYWLTQSETVERAVVIVKNLGNGDQKLVAYVQIYEGLQLAVKDLKAYISNSLPAYMLPNIIVALDELPVSSNGKLDREMLPWPVQQEELLKGKTPFDSQCHKNQPVEHIESTVLEKLLEFSKNALSRSELNKVDDLFNAGATSMTMVQMIEWINDQFSVIVPLEQLLSSPNIAAVGSFISKKLLEANPVKKPEASHQNTEEPQPTSYQSATQTASQFGKELVQLEKVSFRAEKYLNIGPCESTVPAPINFSMLSGLLGTLREFSLDGQKKYLYPSSGGLNPIQAYLYVKNNKVEGVPQGYYYYHPKLHKLIAVDSSINITAKSFPAYLNMEFKQAHFVIFLCTEFTAIKPLYQDKSIDLAAMEAGYVAQLLLSRQHHFDLKLTPVMSLDYSSISPLTDGQESRCYLFSLLGFNAGSRSGKALANFNAGNSMRPDIVLASQQYRLKNKLISAQAEMCAETSKPLERLSKEEQKTFYSSEAYIRKFAETTAEISLKHREFRNSDLVLRSCQREFEDEPISFQRFSQFLGLLKSKPGSQQEEYLFCPFTEKGTVKTYIFVKEHRVTGVAEGIYEYSPIAHTLRVVNADLTIEIKSAFLPFNRRHYEKCHFCVFVIANTSAKQSPLSEDAKLYAAMESGAMGQLLMDRQCEFDIGICPIGGIEFQVIESEFDLPDEHEFIQAFVCGRFTHDLSERRDFIDDREVVSDFKYAAAPVATAKSECVCNEDVAIVGIAFKFPGADDTDEFWQNLSEGNTAIQALPEGRRRIWGEQASQNENWNESSKTAGFLDDITSFDSLFFNISPAEARTMDPQERMFLEVAWKCMENAAYTSRSLQKTSKTVGVYIGAMWNDYQIQGHTNWLLQAKDTLVSASHSTAANRISNKLNFTGPSIAIDTSCSSSGTAIHYACESIREYKTDAALVGGINLISDSYHYGLLADLDFVAKSGISKPFSSQSEGIVLGEGIGALLLKRLSQAQVDGDKIYGVIKGTHISHYGGESPFGRPNTNRQLQSMSDAFEKSGIPVDTISYVEAAAAGASIADASEINALRKLLENTSIHHKVLFGSLKANIGHLESASTMSQVVKVLLQMQHQQILPSGGFKSLSPLIQLNDANMSVATNRVDWQAPEQNNKKRPRRALINSFGATGTAAHLIIEEPPTSNLSTNREQRATVVPLSSTDPIKLIELVRSLYKYLESHGEQLNINDIGFSMQNGREPLAERLAIVATSVGHLTEQLRSILELKRDIPGVYLMSSLPEAPQKASDESDILHQLALEWVRDAREGWHRCEVKWAKRIPLPGYQFQRVRHWLADARQSSDKTQLIDPKMSHSEVSASHERDTLATSRDQLPSITSWLKETFSKVLEVPIEQIDASTPMYRYGINSLLILKLDKTLKDELGDVPITIFYECQTIEELVSYLSERHSDLLASFGRLQAPLVSPSPIVSEHSAPVFSNVLCNLKDRLKSANESWDMAIIGLSGRYPGAEDVNELWENLLSGENCITEIPEERWDWAEYYDQKKGQAGKSYSKWGGFIKDYNKFDPLFFEIAPREAEIMDPQERVFLETAYSAIEDAAYLPSELAQDGRVGVFVGVMHCNYLTGARYFSVANRISYVLNFNGPSMALDTACSSSLTAIHLAIQAISNGECDVAIAGGVNLITSPEHYLELAAGRVLSPDGKCKSFGVGADGIVIGEGVGALILKELHQAESDGDHIYGVIKGSAINTGGKTRGYTVPSLVSQSNVISEAISRAGINPRAISYIEAHGTGTELGDPIEIAGLTRSFRRFSNENQYCAIGSVKSNIGHCESAAGMSGLTKVLLQMQHKTLVKSLHSEHINSKIKFSDTPFQLQQTTLEWQRPVLEKNGEQIEYPRIAGVSSFGSGGTNSHIIIQEYISKPGLGNSPRHTDSPCVIVLSAQTDEQLRQQTQRLWRFLQTIPEAIVLEDIAYSLQVGRIAMDSRLGFVADSIANVQQKLEEILDTGFETPDIIRGRVNVLDRFSARKPGDFVEESDVLHWCEENQFQKLLEAWANGKHIDWSLLYQSRQMPKRVSLPSYPFFRERYWFDDKEKTKFQSFGAQNYISPVLHANTSSFIQQRFTSTFTGRELFLSHHRIKGNKTLPGVVHIEMARVAIMQSLDTKEKCILLFKNIAWYKPYITDQSLPEIHIELREDNDGDIAFTTYQENDSGERILFCKGYAELASEKPEQGAIEISPVDDTISLTKQQVYSTFTTIGFQYGDFFRCIEKLYLDPKSVVARLTLPNSLAYTLDDYLLHPGLLDASLHASIGLFLENQTGERLGKQLLLPFAIDELQIHGGLSETLLVHVRLQEHSAASNIPRLNVIITDEQGLVCVTMMGVSLRASETRTDHTLVYAKPVWQEQPVKPAAGKIYNRKIAILCDYRQQQEQDLKRLLPDYELHFQDYEGTVSERFTHYAGRLLDLLKGVIKSSYNDPILVQLVVQNTISSSCNRALSGLLISAHKENPQLACQTIEITTFDNASGIALRLSQEANSEFDTGIKFCGEQRFARAYEQVQVSAHQQNAINERPWRRRGVYLITGGAGKVGRIFASAIIGSTEDAIVVIAGRSASDSIELNGLQNLADQSLNSIVRYKQVDFSDIQQCRDLISEIVNEYGGINGILHSAGVLQDGMLCNKSITQLETVLAPKVSGLVNLDIASSNIKLDFFVGFSSITGEFGNFGQCDYATANLFMDEYLSYRRILENQGERFGSSLSIAWPLWSNGDMQATEAQKSRSYETLGFSAMPDEQGIEAFYRALSAGLERVLVFFGREEQIKNLFNPQFSSQPPESMRGKLVNLASVQENRSKDTSGTSALLEYAHIDSTESQMELALQYFKNQLSSVIKVSKEKIDANLPLEKYGMDSILAMQITDKLELIFGSLSKTLFFEYGDIKSIARYFLEAYSEKMQEVLSAGKTAGSVNKAINTPLSNLNYAWPEKYPTTSTLGSIKSQQTDGQKKDTQRNKASNIAIIGLAGRYPGAANLDQLWSNLRDGVDSITTIPKDRWDYTRYFDEDKSRFGTTYSKWGGFLQDIDKFDPLFFNISPRDAEFIDPQERLFLECVYQAVEDAGFVRNNSENPFGNLLPRDVGVFVGVMYQEYQLYGAQGQYGVDLEKQMHNPEVGKAFALGGSLSSVANRVSYFFDFHGPSIGLDTMCSSSLTAIHLACSSIAAGQCELAVAGGVNLNLHPNKYLLLSQGKFASTNGRCMSFGQGGDGYVPGEGVGAVLLKPLAEAISSGDNIHAVIKGSAVNHGGKTSSYTVPNLNSQSELIAKTLQDSGVNVNALGYIEAHGTGTALGDPIEINALSKALKEQNHDATQCVIGSIKSNIGHLESAAGIAGLTKVILQMKHGKLAPSLHSEVLNPNIKFSEVPFRVQQNLGVWPRPVVVNRCASEELPRLAGVSSFGAGGSNAHLVIEEYIPVSFNQVTSGEDVIVVLSTSHPEQLLEAAKALLTFISQQSMEDSQLVSLAYTLQVGREVQDERLAIIAHSMDDLCRKLLNFTEGSEELPDVFSGTCKNTKENIGLFAEDDDFQQLINTWLIKGKLQKLINAWLKGYAINWFGLYGDTKPVRMSLPGVVFAKQSYWFPTLPGANLKRSMQLHPLLHRNTSNIEELRFSSRFTGNENFFNDHRIGQTKVLPAVAYLEMADAAIRQSLTDIDNQLVCLAENQWLRPMVVEGSELTVNIRVIEDDESELGYEVFGIDVDGSEIKFCQGKVFIEGLPASESLKYDVTELINYHSTGSLSHQEVYGLFESMGLNYGVSHRGIKQVLLAQDSALAEIEFPCEEAELQDYRLPPGIADAGLQATIALALNSDIISDNGASLPFSLEEVTLFKACTQKMWALVSKATENNAITEKYDIVLVDENGSVCAELLGYTSRTLKEARHKKEESINDLFSGTIPLAPMWVSASPEYVQANEEESCVIVVDGAKFPFGEHLSKSNFLDLQKHDKIEEIEKRLKGLASFKHLVFVAPKEVEDGSEKSLIEAQQSGVMLLFKLLKSLIQLGFKTKKLRITVITRQAVAVHQEAVFPAHASIHGFMGCLAKEYLNWQVNLVDLEQAKEIPIEVLGLQAQPEGEIRAYRNGEWFVQKLLPVKKTLQQDTTAYKQSGVYVVLGGAGGIGEAWTEYAIRQYGANVIWLGRSSCGQVIDTKLNRLSRLGVTPRYIQADASDLPSLQTAFRTIKQEYGQINGVIHSSIVIDDHSLLNMSESSFKRVLMAKVDTSVNLSNVIKDEPLDFILYFSSMLSFTKAPGQSNYAAGCAFVDAFARYQSQSYSYPVKVMNWGFWGTVGVVAGQAIRDKMARAGIGSIEPPEAMEALESLLQSDMQQLAFVKTSAGHSIKNALQHGDELEILHDYSDYTVHVNTSLAAYQWQAPNIAELDLKIVDELAAVLEELDTKVADTLFLVLQDLGVFESSYFKVRVTETKNKLLPGFKNWVVSTTLLLENLGYLQKLGSGFIVLDGIVGDKKEIWQKWEAYRDSIKDNESLRLYANIIDSALKKLPEILTGKLSLSELASVVTPAVLYKLRNVENAVLEKLYRSHLIATMQTWLAVQTSLLPSIRLNILELQPEASEASHFIYDGLLNFHNSFHEYCIVQCVQELSEATHSALKQRHSDLVQKHLQLNQSLQQQGMTPANYDLVVVSNLLSGSGDIRRTLQKIKLLMKKNAVLLLCEISNYFVLHQMTTGLIESARFDDDLLRNEGSRAMPPNRWEQVLKEQGFHDIEYPDREVNKYGQQIIICKSNGLAREILAPNLHDDAQEVARHGDTQQSIGILVENA